MTDRTFDKLYMGVEFGSTRIKAVLIDDNQEPIANGVHDWENRFEGGYWTYHLEDFWEGMQDAFSDLKRDFKEKYGQDLRNIAAIGVSAMMHGYLAFDGNDELVAPFRTWRNTTTGPAAEELTALFNFNVPQRWSVSHLYQAILNKEERVDQIKFMTTPAGYVHWKLTGKKVLGLGDASGMFPIDSSTMRFDAEMEKKFNDLLKKNDLPYTIKDIFPEILTAGDNAGLLTAEGALLLDPTGELKPGIPFCPPEGDAGTGMVATNSVSERTGNISAGTSIFAMTVLENPLKAVHPEIDMVTTPDGKPVAMVHCNTCSTEIDEWIRLFKGMFDRLGVEVSLNDLYQAVFSSSLEGEKDAGGLFFFNYFSGEPVVGSDKGTPALFRRVDSDFSLQNVCRALIFSAFSTLAVGMRILDDEGVKIDKMFGHGGLFKTTDAGQRLLSGGLNVPISVMSTAGEGGPWGMAILAQYMIRKEVGETLGEYLNNKVFATSNVKSVNPATEDVEGFKKYIETYCKLLPAENLAADVLG
ncbi:MAG: ATPase [Oscillospiraceae bacterium]|nr:ATPase [Oscillospiraceae bacterium]